MVSRLWWPRNMTFLEVDRMVVTWWIVNFLPTLNYLVCTVDLETLFKIISHSTLYTLGTLLYGFDNLEWSKNKDIISATQKVIIDSKKFDRFFICVNHRFLLCSCSDCVCVYHRFVVNVSFIIILLMSICISSSMTRLNQTTYQPNYLVG